MPEDIYQQRYLEHQARKGKVLELIAKRHSERIFGTGGLEENELETVEASLLSSPSSCNRQAVFVQRFGGRKHKCLISGALVGGVGWSHRAAEIWLFFADMKAYKSDAERAFMPYLDTGVMAENVYLACTELDLACCFINPNSYYDINDLLGFDKETTSDWLFTGAMAIGRKSEEKTDGDS